MVKIDMMDFNRKINTRIREVKPSGIRKFFDIVAEREGVISLGVGEPDFRTPDHISMAGIEAIRAGKTKYTSNQGLIELRREIAHYYKRRFNVE